jgi:hypothetical protein
MNERVGGIIRDIVPFTGVTAALNNETLTITIFFNGVVLTTSYIGETASLLIKTRQGKTALKNEEPC